MKFAKSPLRKSSLAIVAQIDTGLVWGRRAHWTVRAQYHLKRGVLGRGSRTKTTRSRRPAEGHRRFNLASGLSKKGFLVGELNFSAPLARPARANVRDHIESREGDRRASVRVGQGLAAAEAAENHHLRDFGSRSIFDFFDSIDPEETFGGAMNGANLPALGADLVAFSLQDDASGW
jgi:hypothetical protein